MAMGMSESEPQTEATVNVCFHTSFKQVKKDKQKKNTVRIKTTTRRCKIRRQRSNMFLEMQNKHKEKMKIMIK